MSVSFNTANFVACFYVTRSTLQQGIEFHGDIGSLHLSSWLIPEASVSYGDFGQKLDPVPLVRPPGKGVRWGTGVVEIMEAALKSAANGAPVDVTSTFPLPAPLETEDA